MDLLKEIARRHILGNPIRLGIMIYLLPRRKVVFGELVDILDLTPGNLDSHLRSLEKEGYIKLKKVLIDRPRTMIVITEKGAVETKRYLKKLRELLTLTNAPEFKS